jgi:ubiquinone/menaquinone biosynthesis C-methylase UbiE
VPSFARRSHKLERIDTGDYTQAEYERYMREIRYINRYLGESRALRKTLLREIERLDLREFSVLDVACGSGELLRQIAEFARGSGRRAKLLAGIDLNELSTSTTLTESRSFPEIAAVRGDAFKLPFADGAFDYAISSLFFHHLADEQIPLALAEMARVTRREVFVIDLHRHPAAYYLFKLFCFAFRISPLVMQDGSLSVLRGFRPTELMKLSAGSGVSGMEVGRTMPFRVVLEGHDRQKHER